jgi:excisionase family DNA binding protein
MSGQQLSYSVVEAAEITGMSKSAIYHAIQSDELRARKPTRGSFVITHKDLDAYLDALPVAS